MNPDERDRLARVEEQGRERGDDIKEIKDLLKGMSDRLAHLERVAATGNGALRTAFIVGGVIGWLVGLAVSIVAVFRH